MSLRFVHYGLKESNRNGNNPGNYSVCFYLQEVALLLSGKAQFVIHFDNQCNVKNASNAQVTISKLTNYDHTTAIYKKNIISLSESTKHVEINRCYENRITFYFCQSGFFSHYIE